MLTSITAVVTGLLLFVLAQAAPAPTGDDLWRLGGFVVALLVGAAVTYRYTTLPERTRTAQADAERIAAQEREREAYQVTTPALIQANANHAAMLDWMRQAQP